MKTKIFIGLLCIFISLTIYFIGSYQKPIELIDVDTRSIENYKANLEDELNEKFLELEEETYEDIENEEEVIEEIPDSYIIDNLECVLQNPELPTGCEITSLTIVLRYYGFDVSKTYMTDNYLNTIPAYSDYPSVGFWGSPYSSHSYGCECPVIVNSANKFFSDNQSELICCDISGTELDDLYQYIIQDKPVIVWATINMVNPYISGTYNMPDGGTYSWLANFHCLVLYGYDKTNNIVYVSDPLKGNTTYDYDIFKQRYEQLKKQACIIET